MLEEVTFGNSFDRDVEGAEWPRGLRRMSFGARFNRRVEGVGWPAGLEQVRLPRLACLFTFPIPFKNKNRCQHGRNTF